MKHMGDLVHGFTEELEDYLFDLDSDMVEDTVEVPSKLSAKEKTFVIALRKLLKAAK